MVTMGNYYEKSAIAFHHDNFHPIKKNIFN